MIIGGSDSHSTACTGEHGNCKCVLKLLNNLVENCDVEYEYFHMYNVPQTQRVTRSLHIYFIQKCRSEMPPKSNNQKKKEAEAARQAAQEDQAAGERGQVRFPEEG